MSVAVVTGANKGLGLEFVRQLATQGWHVIACARHAPAAGAAAASLAANPRFAALAAIAGQITVMDLEIADDASRVSAASVIASHVDHIDLLINNAGV